MPSCVKCGKEHLNGWGQPSCKAHRASDPTIPCRGLRVGGMEVCRMHGGGAPRAKELAAERVSMAKAAKVMVTLGVQRDTTPTEALLEEVRWTAGHVMWLREKVQQLNAEWEEISGAPVREHPLVWGVTEQKDIRADKNPGVDTTEAAIPSVWYQLYVKERAHLVAVCTAALRAGVEERRVKLAEQQGDLVATVIRRILDDLVLTTEQQSRVAEVVPRHLRLIAGGDIS